MYMYLPQSSFAVTRSDFEAIESTGLQTQEGGYPGILGDGGGGGGGGGEDAFGGWN